MESLTDGKTYDNEDEEGRGGNGDGYDGEEAEGRAARTLAPKSRFVQRVRLRIGMGEANESDEDTLSPWS